jgi:hypothetical protein
VSWDANLGSGYNVNMGILLAFIFVWNMVGANARRAASGSRGGAASLPPLHRRSFQQT